MKSLLTRARLFCGFFEPFFFPVHILRLSCAHLISSSIMAVTFACESRCARASLHICVECQLALISDQWRWIDDKDLSAPIAMWISEIHLPIQWHAAHCLSERELDKRQFFVCRSSPNSTRSRLSRCSSAREKFLFSVERYIDGKKMESDSN